MPDKSLQIPEITPKELENILNILDKMKNPPALMVYGAPGIGKTSILSDFAKSKNYDLRVKHLSRMDATDWSGIPKQSSEQKYTEFMPISIFKPLEYGKKKIIIFFDELNTAMPQVLNAALDVILEKKGEGEGAVLPENTIILAAGNLGEEDGTYVEQLSAAVKTRMIQVRMRQDNLQWINWAESKQLNKTVIEFIKKHTDSLIDLSGFRNNEDQVATPRGWERISDFMEVIFNNENLDYIDKETIFKNMVTGTIGKKKGNLFIDYHKSVSSGKHINSIQWKQDMATAKQYYSGNVADMTVKNLTELTKLINYGLIYDFSNSKSEAKYYAEFMTKRTLSKNEAVSLSTLDLKELENYLLNNGYEELADNLRAGR